MEKITSRRNPLCAHLKKLGSVRGYRESCGEFLCDGVKLLEEAVKNGVDVTNVLTATHIPFPLPVETRVHYVDRSLIDYISPLKNAQDILFTCKFPRAAGHADSGSVGNGERGDSADSGDSVDSGGNNDSADSGGITGTHVLLDGMQDPGNVGTIIRTANAFGIKSVILTGDCADPYNPKTIRATMGAIFRQVISHMSILDLSALKKNGARFVASAPDGQSKDISTVVLKDSIIAIGSEGRGLSGEVLALCDEVVRIPIAPGCESLNAAIAAAIFIYLARG